MSVSMTWASKKENQDAVVARFRRLDLPTVEGIAAELGTTVQTVRYVTRLCLSYAERKALSSVRYSKSKTGDKNPMWGKKGEKHHRWKGECGDGRGYLTCLVKGKRTFVHRLVVARALGVVELPEVLDVHHIDGNTANNVLDNLALVTAMGHKTIHFLQVKDSLSLQLKRSTLAEALQFMTSR